MPGPETKEIKKRIWRELSRRIGPILLDHGVLIAGIALLLAIVFGTMWASGVVRVIELSRQTLGSERVTDLPPRN